MAEISLPASLQDVEPVRSVRTPAQLDYTFTAGDATTRFLNGITQKKIIGQQATPQSKVYVPPRGADPELGAATPIEVEVAQVHRHPLVLRGQRRLLRRSSGPGSAASALISSVAPTCRSCTSSRRSPPTRCGSACGSKTVAERRRRHRSHPPSIKWFRPGGEPDDPNVHIPGRTTARAWAPPWVGGVAPTEALIRLRSEGGQA